MLQIFTKHHDDGIDFAFGCESEIKGYAVGDAETDIYPFLEELVDVVSDGDAIILQEVRNDNLRYVTVCAYFITSETWDFVDFSDCVMKKAYEVTRNPDFTTNLEY